jgi:hypothetical protein
VFDFLTRHPKVGYTPVNALADVRPARFLFGKVPVRGPIVRSPLAYPTFLERVSAAGYRVLALRQPLLFPAREMPGGQTLSGLGTPDVAGSSAYAIYQAGFGFGSEYTVFWGHRIRLEGPTGARTYDTYLEGPFDPTGRAEDGAKRRLTVPLRFERGERGEPVTITVGGAQVRVAAGERSSWLRVVFTLPSWPARDVSTRVRFEVKGTDPLEVLVEPVQIDPLAPVLPLSWPKAYAGDIERRYGPYKTMGWTEQTFALNDGHTSEAAFLKDLLEDMEHGEAVLRGELARGGRCVFYCFTQTDRAAHCFFWRRDPAHPLRGSMAMALAALPDPLRDVYRRMDRIVGGVAGALGPDDVLLVASDHGFQSWRRGMNVNQWLVNEGYLVLESDAEGRPVDAEEKTLSAFSSESLKTHVDWSKTRAYAMGLGQIYVNRKGRESEGIVEEADVPALLSELEAKLLAFRDVDRTAPLSKVYRLHEIYEGPHRLEAAELQLAFRPGYRVSWQTALLGGMRRGGPVCEDNLVAWSGDHCSTDRDAVPGILLSNRPLPAAPPETPYHLRAVAATALAHFGLDASDLDAVPLPLAPRPR